MDFKALVEQRDRTEKWEEKRKTTFSESKLAQNNFMNSAVEGILNTGALFSESNTM